MNAEIRNTDIDLEGLLQVLGENLYSTPIVVIRELVQNAHDAVVRRRQESEWDDVAELFVRCDPANNRLTLRDNGSGLTRSEIIQFLATIGSGYTRVLRNRTNDPNAVGYFGLGFLTAYVVAEQVEFITTSYQDASETNRFTSKGGKQYSIDQAEKADIGSAVVLHLKPDFDRLADGEYLEMILKKYCCLLPVDIYLNGSDVPINRLVVPWRDSDVPLSDLRLQKLRDEFAAIFDQSFEPITTIPIPHNEKLGIEGLIWIQDGSYYANSDNRVTSVFIRSMHVTDNCKELLPSWAGFVGCVVDAKQLTPTASRESIKDDEMFHEACEYVRTVLIDALKKMARSDNPVWRRVISRHNQALLGAAVSDPSLFDVMKHALSLPTSDGELPITEIVRRSGDNQLRLTLDEAGGYEYLVAKSMGIPIIYGYRFAVARFCRAIAESDNYTLVTIGGVGSSEALFPAANIDEQTHQALLNHFGADGVSVTVSEYEPHALPIVRVLDQDALLKQRMASDQMDKSLGGAALLLARQFTDELQVDNESYLYLNYANPLVREFASLPSDRQHALAQSLIAIISIVSGQSGQSQTSIEAMEQLTRSLRQLTTGEH